MQIWLWLAFFASFAVKMPMWPVHTWLPDAHVEAPTAGSVILAGILLKMGGYGFLRFSLPMFPDASHYFAPLVFALSVIAIVYTSLVALVQEDMKKLIAYSSVAHMGFVTMGLFTMTPQGIQGAIFLMISHGIVSGALFLCVGVIYDRMHTREIAAYGGLVNRMPRYAFAFMVFTMANIGLPGTSGFVGEFLTMLAAFQVNTWVAFFATLGHDPGGRLRAVPLPPRHLREAREAVRSRRSRTLSPREIVILVPLILLTLYYGVHPAPDPQRLAGRGRGGREGRERRQAPVNTSRARDGSIRTRSWFSPASISRPSCPSSSSRWARSPSCSSALCSASARRRCSTRSRSCFSASSLLDGDLQPPDGERQLRRRLHGRCLRALHEGIWR